jgi:hypothetical protein
MKDSAYYPAGAYNDPKAPYNEKENPEEEIEVTVSMTISKTIKVLVKDYTTSIEDDGEQYYKVNDYSDCDLNKAVCDQVTLPPYLAGFVDEMFKVDLDLKAAKMPICLQSAVEDCKGWNLDEFEVIKE